MYHFSIVIYFLLTGFINKINFFLPNTVNTDFCTLVLILYIVNTKVYI